MLVLSLLTTFLFTSCTEDEPKKKLTNTELLCLAPWKLVDETIEPGYEIGSGEIITNTFAREYPDCVKDNQTKYEMNGEGVIDEGSVKCNPTDPQKRNLKWSFNTDESKFILNEIWEYSIISLNESELIWTYFRKNSGTGNPDINYKLTAKFKH